MEYDLDLEMLAPYIPMDDFQLRTWSPDELLPSEPDKCPESSLLHLTQEVTSYLGSTDKNTASLDPLPPEPPSAPNPLIMLSKG